MDRILGIDLGTTNSVVSYMEQGQPIVIQNAEGCRTTPSMVLYKSPDEIIVGELAKRQAVSFPGQTIKSVKRFMGVRFSERTPLMEDITYKLVEGPEDSILIDLGWTKVSPEEVSAEILKKMRKTAEEFFGEKIRRAVITVPAYFNDSQRSATKRAGELAGLEILRMINEPTAAALAFGIEKKVKQKVAIFDLGGGTFDVSILEVDKDLFEVRSTRGDTFLGGDVFDSRLLRFCLEEFESQNQIDLSKDVQAFQRLKEAVETAKCELSSTCETIISLPFITMGTDGPLHFQQTITRSQFEELISDLNPRMEECCDSAIADARLQRGEIETALLVGGSTRIPMIQKLVKDHFEREPAKTVNPDEAVAIGAAIQGAIMSGSLREVLLLDVTPLSLGIELAGGIFGPLIARNSSIPTSYTKTFTTVKDNQTSVKIHVLQGERKVALENHSLGLFTLKDITPAPKELPAIDVTFHIDANGILHVQATDVTSGSSNAIVIESYATTSPEQAEEIVNQAENSVEEDRAFVKRKFLQQQAENYLTVTTEALSDPEYPLPQKLANEVRDAAFRFDVAVRAKTMEEAERAYVELKELFSEVEGHLAMIQHRRGMVSALDEKDLD